MLSSFDRNRDCSANSGSTETKTFLGDCADARNKIAESV